jgi:GT2 family glycosyltransferase
MTKKTVPDVTVTVVSWNTRSLLEACLHSLATACRKYYLEIHVVDNASSDGSAEMVHKEQPAVKLFRNRDNVGFARANNQSWNQAQGRYWMLLNSDAEAGPGSVDAIIDFMDANPRAGLAGACLCNPDGSPQYCAQPPPSILRTITEACRLHKLLPGRLRRRWLLSTYWTYDLPVRVGWTWGTALIARREAVQEVGPLAEEFFMYGEDVEWCLRMRRRGWEVWFCPEAKVLHHGGQSSARKWDNPKLAQLKADGYYRAVARHYGWPYSHLLRVCNLSAIGIQAIADRLRRKPVL